jgi:hypothetical protein
VRLEVGMVIYGIIVLTLRALVLIFLGVERELKDTVLHTNP